MTVAALARKRERERERIMVATLSLAGEIGYGELTVAKILARSGGSRGQFYSHFANVDACFAAAYEREAERLCTTLIDAIDAVPGWRERVRAAVTALVRYAIEQPRFAKSLLGEVYLAEEVPRRKHDEVVGRLLAAIGRPPDETPAAHLDPDSIASTFAVGAVEGFLRLHLAREEPATMLEAIPELMFLIVSFFLGRAAAQRELDQPPG